MWCPCPPASRRNAAATGGGPLLSRVLPGACRGVTLRSPIACLPIHRLDPDERIPKPSRAPLLPQYFLPRLSYRSSVRHNAGVPRPHTFSRATAMAATSGRVRPGFVARVRAPISLCGFNGCTLAACSCHSARVCLLLLLAANTACMRLCLLQRFCSWCQRFCTSTALGSPLANIQLCACLLPDCAGGRCSWCNRTEHYVQRQQVGSAAHACSSLLLTALSLHTWHMAPPRMNRDLLPLTSAYCMTVPAC